jgi:hypothetical protein
MATVKMFGSTFQADLLEHAGTAADGAALYNAIARTHTGRTAPGTPITVRSDEIVKAAPAEIPQPGQVISPAVSSVTSADTGASQAQLEGAMAKERETLPSPASLIAEHNAKATAARAAQEGVSVSSGPM